MTFGYACNILALVIAGHLIGDWIVQTDKQAAAKASSWLANQRHMATYHATLILIVGPVWHSWSAVATLAVSWATHSFIDRRWPVRVLMERTGSKPFSQTSWGPMVVDQALHLAILCLCVGWLA